MQLAADVSLEEITQVVREGVTEAGDTGVVDAQRTRLGRKQLADRRKEPRTHPLHQGPTAQRVVLIPAQQRIAGHARLLVGPPERGRLDREVLVDHGQNGRGRDLRADPLRTRRLERVRVEPAAAVDRRCPQQLRDTDIVRQARPQQLLLPSRPQTPSRAYPLRLRQHRRSTRQLLEHWLLIDHLLPGRAQQPPAQGILITVVVVEIRILQLRVHVQDPPQVRIIRVLAVLVPTGQRHPGRVSQRPRRVLPSRTLHPRRLQGVRRRRPRDQRQQGARSVPANPCHIVPIPHRPTPRYPRHAGEDLAPVLVLSCAFTWSPQFGARRRLRR